MPSLQHQKLQSLSLLQEMWIANLRGTSHIYIQTSKVSQGFSAIRFVDSKPPEIPELLEFTKSDPKVLELTVRDCRRTTTLTHNILRMGDYMRYQVSNCDLKGDRAYFFSHEIFPLALVEVKVEKTGLQYSLLDSEASIDYTIPPLRVMKLEVDIVRKYWRKLLDGDVLIEDLVITKLMSRNPKRYRQHVSQVIAPEQLIKEGT